MERLLIDDGFLLRAAMASPGLALIGATLDGAISTWSQGSEHLYGWSTDEAIGQPLMSLVPANGLDEFLALAEAVAAGQEPPAVHTMRRAKDGSLVPVESHAFIVRDGAGCPVGWVAVESDLRRTRRAELALDESEEELRARDGGPPVAQSRVDLHGRILSVNAPMEELLARPASELIGSDVRGLYLDSDRDGVERALASALEAQVQHHWTLRRPGGDLVPVSVTISAMPAADGQTIPTGSVEVTALREAEKPIRSDGQRLDVLLQTMPLVVFSYDLDARCTYSGGRALSDLGLAPGALVGASLLEHYGDRPQITEAIHASLAGREAMVTGDEAGRFWQAHYRPLRVSGEVVGAVAIVVDVTKLVTAEREVRANEARLTALFRKSSDVVLVVDGAGQLLWASPAVERVLGRDPSSLFWRRAWDLTHPDDIPRMSGAWRRVREGHTAGEPVSCRLQRADGSWRWFDCSFTDLVDDPDVGGMVLNLRDVTDRIAGERDLQRMALHDPLTGLPNRLLLLDRVSGALKRAKGQERQAGLVLLEIVGMKEISDSFGHEVGDLALCSVAGRLLESASAFDSVARTAGDQFAVLIEDVASAEELRARAAAILFVLQGSLELADLAFDLRVRAGSALSPAASAGDLLSAAERSLDAIDASSRHAVVAQVVVEKETGAERVAIAELRRAIEQEELRLHFQPVVQIESGELVGAEALVRWQHPERGLLPPLEFIPLAESTGLVVQLGEWVLREACVQAAAWQAAGRPMGIGVNLSPVQLRGGAFPDLVRRVLAETGLLPERLVLEVTESALMDDPNAPALLGAISELGVRLALDDFGTGYSSMSYLKRFPVDAIKIDRSFVAGLGRDADDEAIVASIVSLGHTIGKIVVAEGVETVGQLDALRALGTDQGQGYLWSPPVDAAGLARWMEPRRQRFDLQPATAVVTLPAAAGVVVGSDEERILTLHTEGASLHTIAAGLDAEGRRTPTGPRWTTTTVARVFAELVGRASR